MHTQKTALQHAHGAFAIIPLYRRIAVAEAPLRGVHLCTRVLKWVHVGAGAGVPRDIVARVGELVSVGCQLCQSAMRAEGIKVLALMSRDVAQMAHISCHIERAKWERIVDVRCLSLLLCSVAYAACQGGHVNFPFSAIAATQVVHAQTTLGGCRGVKLFFL